MGGGSEGAKVQTECACLSFGMYCTSTGMVWGSGDVSATFTFDGCVLYCTVRLKRSML